MPVKINGSTSGSVTLAAPATGSDVTLTLPTTALATLASPSFTGNLVWSGSTLRADSATVITGQTTTSTSYTDLATVGPAVTVTTGTKALVIISAQIETSTTVNIYATAGFAVSGATTTAAPAGNEVFIRSPGSAFYAPIAVATVVTGLTAGSNTFTMKYKTSNASYSAYFGYRVITVIDLGS